MAIHEEEEEDELVDASQVGGGQLKILFALYSKYSQIHLNFTTESIIDRRI